MNALFHPPTRSNTLPLVIVAGAGITCEVSLPPPPTLCDTIVPPGIVAVSCAPLCPYAIACPLAAAAGNPVSG